MHSGFREGGTKSNFVFANFLGSWDVDSKNAEKKIKIFFPEIFSQIFFQQFLGKIFKNIFLPYLESTIHDPRKFAKKKIVEIFFLAKPILKHLVSGAFIPF